MFMMEVQEHNICFGVNNLYDVCSTFGRSIDVHSDEGASVPRFRTESRSMYSTVRRECSYLLVYI